MGADRLAFNREVQRKLIHILFTAIPLIYWLGWDKTIILSVCVFLAAGFLTADLLRMKFPLAKRYFLIIFLKLLREDEIKKDLTGATYLFLGMSATVFLFSKEAAVPALFFATLADPVAALAGKSFGRHRVFNKTVEGFEGFFFTALMIVLIFTDFGFWGLSVALIAAFIELLPLSLSDNLLIPVLSGILFSLAG